MIIQKQQKEIWIISDTHFGHKNIIEYDNLPFKNEFTMNDYIINHWNSKISKEDIVLHLGDLFVGSSLSDNFRLNIFKKLNGNIFLIRGNHDKRDDIWYKDYLGIKNVTDFYIFKDFFFCHFPLFEFIDISQKRKNKFEERIDLLRQAYEISGCKYVFHGHSHQPQNCLNENHYNVVANKNDFYPYNLLELAKTLKWKL